MEVKIINNEKKNLEFEVKDLDPILLRILTERLNAEKDVEFAAYKIEHILAPNPRTIVKTKTKDALSLVLEKLEGMQEDFGTFKKQFKEALK